jgi:glycerate-2-kinase
MAKTKRTTVASICKPKETGKPDYLKIRGETREVFAKALLAADPAKGMSLKLESKQFQLQSLEDAVTAGKLSSEMASKVKERINKIPEYVRFEVILLSDAEA